MEPPRIMSNTTRRSRLVPGIIFCVLTLFLLLVAAIAIGWNIMNPHEPSIRVGSLSVSNFSVSDSQLSGTYGIGFTISNPNEKIDMFLDEFTVVVFYGEAKLSGDTVQPVHAFSLGRMRETNRTVDIVIKADSPKLVKKKVFADVGEHWRKQVVNFNVRMELSIRFESGNWPSSSKQLNPYCDDLDVFFRDHKDAGKLLGIGKDCRV